MRSIYQQWLDGDYSNPGGFEYKIFLAYQHAGEPNREKLEGAFPEFFKVKELELPPGLALLRDSLINMEVDFENVKNDDLYRALEVGMKTGNSLRAHFLKDWLIIQINDGLSPIDIYARLEAWSKAEEGVDESWAMELFWETMKKEIDI